MRSSFVSLSFTARVVPALALAAAFAGVVASCGGAVRGDVPGVGDACTPSIERDPAFRGFNENEVTIENGAQACRTQVCLVNHFRGEVASAYGNANVVAQCADRTAAKAVYCSCRCSNAENKTDDSDDYCKCPDDFECANIVGSIGAPNDHFSGGYCIKKGTAYDSRSSCALSCDATAQPCP